MSPKQARRALQPLSKGENPRLAPGSCGLGAFTCYQNERFT